MLPFLALVIIIKDFISSFFLFSDLFELLFLKIYSFKGSYNTLSPSLNLLNDSDSSLHVSIKSCSLLNNLLFRKGCFFKIEKELFYDLISLLFIRIFIIFEISWDGHFDLCRSYSHLKKKLIEIDVLWTYRVCCSVVSDEIELELNDSEHSRLEHILE